MFLQQGGVWIAHRNQRPKGLVHFIGGAFAGAAPQVLYNLFIELLAQEGYTVITTPYHVTFRHTDTAHNVSQVGGRLLHPTGHSGCGDTSLCRGRPQFDGHGRATVC